LSDFHGITQLKPANSQIVAVSAMLRGRVNLRHSLPYVSGKRHQPAEQAQLIFTPSASGKSNNVVRTGPIRAISDIRWQKGDTITDVCILPHHPFVETAQEEYDQATLNSPASASASKQLFPRGYFQRSVVFMHH